MGDAEYTFAQARTRLEDIVSQVRKKDMSLEASLDLLEEGVRLANTCTEQIDQSEWRTLAGDTDEAAGDTDEAAEDTEAVAEDGTPAGATAGEPVTQASENGPDDGRQEPPQQ